MSLWTRIADALSALTAGEPLSAVFDRLRGTTPDTPDHSVGFTIAVIALGAKMAKADGQVTRAEVAAFRRIFTIDEAEEQNAARVFNLARQDVAGFDAYARKIAAMFGTENRDTLRDLLEGLFHIALADGTWHPREEEFLHEVARIFGLDDRCFSAIRARFIEGAPRDPFDVLGVPPDATLAEIRTAWKALVRESHPDRMIARGVPAEAVKLAERRLIDINAAWEEISNRRAA
ncbi:molecular chaperone DjlA [Gemmobacter aquarius]|uniref:Molecular chaperone DjlA n=1 Tax=Paragemmobacter aquarius TaxID=2169400 RepID=A0A2S0UJK5_9RHOB|nr:molecular chaperone DjiA [Gemmobacter aquarius]AWB47951.1 molecular chaperone DjlA [Gemmobacter aquarius]